MKNLKDYWNELSDDQKVKLFNSLYYYQKKVFLRKDFLKGIYEESLNPYDSIVGFDVLGNIMDMWDENENHNINAKYFLINMESRKVETLENLDSFIEEMEKKISQNKETRY